MRAVIFANGAATSPEIAQSCLQPDAIVIAADGGARNAWFAGVTPDTVIGDLDSLPAALRADLEGRGVRFSIHPPRKDETDLELAIRRALERGATDIVILSALGGRWDQALANVLLLTLPALRERHVPACIVDERQTLRVITSDTPARIEGRSGDTLSLIALGGDASGVTIEGCEYPLTEDRLPFGETLGISNVLREPVARVHVKDGIVLAIHIRET
ncbi:MAG TPA: thiamine diphosphokinase [Anaerolineae bacterium]|nr:thiamine diphosphokinase [Anaerolineae bacterium]